jgi:hypothetical protein
MIELLRTHATVSLRYRAGQLSANRKPGRLSALHAPDARIDKHLARRAFETSRRREDLTFRQHAEVCASKIIYETIAYFD